MSAGRRLHDLSSPRKHLPHILLRDLAVTRLRQGLSEEDAPRPAVLRAVAVQMRQHTGFVDRGSAFPAHEIIAGIPERPVDREDPHPPGGTISHRPGPGTGGGAALCGLSKARGRSHIATDCTANLLPGWRCRRPGRTLWAAGSTRRARPELAFAAGQGPAGSGQRDGVGPNAKQSGASQAGDGGVSGVAEGVRCSYPRPRALARDTARDAIRIETCSARGASTRPRDLRSSARVRRARRSGCMPGLGACPRSAGSRGGVPIRCRPSPRRRRR